MIMQSLFAGAVAAGVSALCNPAMADAKRAEDTSAMTAEVLPPGNSVAILKREFDGAVAAGTREALLRFIARHPGHPLTGLASRKLDGLSSDGGNDGDPDRDVYRAFDAARRAGTQSAYRAFARQYPTHPLASEAEQRVISAPR